MKGREFKTKYKPNLGVRTLCFLNWGVFINRYSGLIKMHLQGHERHWIASVHSCQQHSACFTAVPCTSPSALSASSFGSQATSAEGGVLSLHVICTLHICIGCHMMSSYQTTAARGPKQVLQLNGCFYRYLMFECARTTMSAIGTLFTFLCIGWQFDVER